MLKRWMAGEYLEADLQGKCVTNLPHIASVSFDAIRYTDKKENQIFLIYMEIQSGAVAKSYMRKGFLIYEEMRKYFPIYEELVIYDFATAPF
jgi:hypothetical protein